MTHNHDLKSALQYALQAFNQNTLADAAIALFETLGYKSEKRFTLSPNNGKQFRQEFDPQGRLNSEKSLVNTWTSVDVLFQITDDEIREALGVQRSRFASSKVDGTLINSYLFFAIGLQARERPYTRADLAAIAREVNKLFPMPVLILFRHGETISIAILHRRLNKHDESRDVLEKVTLIKDIRIAAPHRAHVETLADLSLAELAYNQPLTNFVDLQRAWEKALDTTELNKRFYREVANWYFWAISQIQFPGNSGSNQAEHKAINAIRLITRLIFVWFIKENGLVPEELFEKRWFDENLNPNDPKKSTYYKAILQNLFFATLNTEMGAGRAFRRENAKGQDPDYLMSNFYRYKRYFKNPEKALELFAGIPFLNGGLFECLDKEIEKGNVIRVDGFSDRDDNPLTVPDDLFLMEQEQEIDLNEIYDTKNKKYKVRGLIPIFNSYKFTIEENTPIEEEIALDPELLGKVFENLLAAYNPETGTTARKQTGSFYTPREIVNYMVDEALVAYLESALIPSPSPHGGRASSPLPSGEGRVREDLRDLLSYNPTVPDFSDAEKFRLIAAIDNIKVLDPACGSGAFPMGVLHKLVFLLAKLDPKNEGWQRKQISKANEIQDSVAREAAVKSIEEVFAENHDDYGRKLYLIENCIYGVDIQPIAVQIAKLRFFISLVVEQKTTPLQLPPNSANLGGEKPNRGIRPLPNLETKFVAANTLIGIQKPKVETNLSFGDLLYKGKQDELKEVRRNHFSARTPATKRKYRDLDKKLRGEISELLKKDGWGSEIAQQLAGWDPYNQNAHADFFDPEWMFGIEGGFDVVIANPPYLGEKGHKEIFREIAQSILGKRFYQGKMDLFYFFFHIALDFGKPSSIIAFITTNYYPTAMGGKKLRKDFKERATFRNLINFNELKIFESALGQHNMVSIIEKGNNNISAKTCITQRQGVASSELLQTIVSGNDTESEYHSVTQHNLYDGEECYIRLGGTSSDASEDPAQVILEKIKKQGVRLDTICLIKTGLDSAADYLSDTNAKKIKSLNGINIGDGIFVLRLDHDADVKLINSLSEKEKLLLKPFYKSSDIERYWVAKKPEKFIIYLNKESPDISKFPAIKTHLEKFKNILLDRREVVNGNIRFFELHWPRNPELFSGEKILVPYRANINTFGYSTAEWFCRTDCYIIKSNQETIKLKYLLALLNSSLFYFWLSLKGKRKGEMLELLQKPLTEIFVKNITKDKQLPFINLVDQILAAKRADPAGGQADTSALEGEIDQLVYQLYGLSEDEIAIVEGK